MGRELGERIAALLKSQGMQQRELAEKIGVADGVLSRYISGSRSPRPETLAKMATALRTTSDHLLGIENEDFDYPRILRMIARNASSMTKTEKIGILKALLEEE